MPREIRQREIQWDEPQKWLVGGGGTMVMRILKTWNLNAEDQLVFI